MVPLKTTSYWLMFTYLELDQREKQKFFRYSKNQSKEIAWQDSHAGVL